MKNEWKLNKNWKLWTALWWPTAVQKYNLPHIQIYHIYGFVEGSTLLSGIVAVWLKLLFLLLVALGDQLPKQTAMSVINTSDGIRGMADLAPRSGGRRAGAAKIYSPHRLLLISKISWTHAEVSHAEAPLRRPASHRCIILALAGLHQHMSMQEAPLLIKTIILLIIKLSVMADRCW